MPIKIPMRTDYSASDLRAIATQTTDVRQSRRLLALAAVADGMSRFDAARIGGMDRQRLRDWVVRYNAEGLIDRDGAGDHNPDWLMHSAPNCQALSKKVLILKWTGLPDGDG